MPEPQPLSAPRQSPAYRELRQFERLLTELSVRFINLPASAVDRAITDALRQIVLHLDVDRCQLIRLPPGTDAADITHSWAVQGVPAVPPKSVAGAYPWVLRRMRDGYPVVAPRIDDFPAEAEADKASFQRFGVRSHLGMPMKVAGRVEGMLAFGCLRRERDWPEDLVARIGALADVFANALAHKRARESLDAAVRFERTVSDVLAALLTAGRLEQDQVIEAGLRDLARLFGAERATLWQRRGDTCEFVKTHRWLAEGVPVPPDSTGAVAVPWITARLVDRSVVRFSRYADLPPEAATDVPALEALGIRAAMIVPLAVADAVVGAVSFATAREDREWPEDLLPRIKLVGEVFGGMLARQEAERREQEAQAQATHAARVSTMGVFAASLVHELTQPLTASLANAETASALLAVPSPDLDELRATVADIVADDRRVVALIQQLRRYLRRGDAERSEFALREVGDETLRLVGAAAADKGVALTVELAESLPTIVGNRVQIQQVLLNLLLNALDAAAVGSPESRRAALRVAPCEAGVSIEVSDSGRGMSEETLARIFQPFFTTKPGGMGLGLSISRTIVAAHGGSLSVQSTPGRGTTFRMELPLRPPEDARPAPPPRAAARKNTGTVFVIDDDASMRRAIERQLQREGFRVETFATAQAYLGRAPHEGVACIVSDVRMPGLSGLDLQASLARENRALPIVFVSGHGDVPTTVHAMRAGAVSFLSKPFTTSALLAAVGEALARSRELDETRREQSDLRTRYDALTPREREVFGLVAGGLLNKTIADRLGAAEATIKIHRGRVMGKMAAASVADLVRMAERLGLQAARAASAE